MSHKLNSGIAVVGISISARTRFTSWATINAVQSCCGRSGHAGRWKRDLPTYRRV
jgi:hypothetical protein